MERNLFRKEAIDAQKERLHGDVFILPRLSHVLILSLLLVWLAALLLWLFTSSYARKETVNGWLEPMEGVIKVYNSGEGTIAKLFVSEGEMVEQGQALATVRSSRTLRDGKHLESVLQDELVLQKTLLNDQIEQFKEIFSLREIEIEKRTHSSTEDLKWLDIQVGTLKKRHNIIVSQVKQNKVLLEEGHVSSFDVDAIVAQELQIRGELQALYRSQIKQKNAIEKLKIDRQLVIKEKRNQLNQLQERLSNTDQELAKLSSQNVRVIKATKAGLITGLQIREGQQAKSNMPLMSIVPEGMELTANLLVPVRSAGFLNTDQKLDIRYDAFPYQKFGLYSGNIKSISRSVILPSELNDAPVQLQEPAYLVKARINQSYVTAYGQDVFLKTGMTLTADVRLSERSIIKWLLEPIYSLKGRL